MPLILKILFNLKTKFILRISGLPKAQKYKIITMEINFKKINLVTCPTIATREYIQKLNIIPKEKFYYYMIQ